MHGDGTCSVSKGEVAVKELQNADCGLRIERLRPRYKIGKRATERVAVLRLEAGESGDVKRYLSVYPPGANTQSIVLFHKAVWDQDVRIELSRGDAIALVIAVCHALGCEPERISPDLIKGELKWL